MTQPATAALMRSINRSAVLDLLRQHGPLARTDLAGALGLSLPTVMRIVDELLAEDLLRTLGRVASVRGRPRTLLAFNGEGSAVIGIDLGGTKIFGTLADLDGNLSHPRYVAHGENNPQNCLDTVNEIIEWLLHAPRPEGQRIRGIGIGAPGITLTPEGVVAWSPQLNWRDLPLRKLLEDRFGLPVFVENDVNLAALGEWGFGAGKGARSLVAIAIGTGIGAGIVLDGAVYHGIHQAAGEVGYLPPGPQFLGRRYDGLGALEGLAAGGGIAARGRTALAALVTAGGATPGNGSLSAETVFAAARSGERWACNVVDDTADYLALAIASVSAVLDPEVVVLGGGVSASADLLIGPVLARLEGVVPYPPRLVASTLGPRSAALGAVMLVLHGTTGRVVVNRQS